MKLSLRRMATLAGLLALATAAIAVDPDATIAISRTANSPTFSVRYSVAAVALAELRINGESVTTRNLNASVTSGETTFNVNLSSFIDGENEIEVRLFDRTGKLVGTERSIVKQESSGKPAVFLSTPKLGATVQGAVEIKVGFGQKFKDSYVSFFIDNQFRTMSNVAPFNYVWDTGRENNGWHELEAWVVNGGDETLKSKKVRVFVDNPGGHTSRRFVSAAKPTPTVPASKPVDLISVGTPAGMTINSNPLKIVPANPSPAPKAAAAVLPLTLLATAMPMKLGAADGLRFSSAPIPAAVAATGLRHMTPTGKRVAATPVPATSPKPTTPVAMKPSSVVLKPLPVSIKPVVVSAKLTAVSKPASTPVAPKVSKPVIEVKPSSMQQGRVALPGAPITGMSISHIRPIALSEDTKPVATGTAAMAPTFKPAPLAHPVRAEAKTVPTTKLVGKSPILKRSSTVTTLVKVQPGFKLPGKGSFAILLDGDIVEFDVQPRIDSGVPMTPFRHLIEKKGGEVIWEAKTKEVNAKADGRAIYLQIGTRIARVDQKSIDLELAPYLDRGRTIVPLSFIRETLKVNVDYDKATGHVLITSIK